MKRLVPVPASPAILEKIEDKHGIDFREIEELFRGPHLVLQGTTDRYGERRYVSLGRTGSGRYLFVVFVLVPGTCKARVITAREMMDRERRYYVRIAGGRKQR